MYVKATTTQENLKTTQLIMVVAQLRATLFQSFSRESVEAIVFMNPIP